MRADTTYFASPPQRLSTTLTQSKVLDLPSVLELLHLPDRHFDRLAGLDSVTVVEIDMIDSQTTQGLLARGLNVFWFIADAALAGLGIDEVGEFGGEEDVLPLSWVSFEPAVVERWTSVGVSPGLGCWNSSRRPKEA